MKYSIFSCTLLLIIATLTCNNKRTPSLNTERDSYSITGQIRGLSAGGVKLVRENEFDHSSELIDSIAFKGGSFTLVGKLVYPQMLRVVIEPGDWSFPVFVENADINLIGDTSGAEYYEDYNNVGIHVKRAHLKNITVTGSKSHDDWMAYNGDLNQTKYGQVIEGLGEKMSAEENEVLKYKIKDQYDSVKILLKASKLDWINHYVDKQPTSVAGVYILSNFYVYSYSKQMPLNELESILKKFSGLAASSDYYESLAASLPKRKALAPGNIAPDFTLLNSYSRPFTLSKSRGKYVMLDFWASWCYPCRKAIPHWKEVFGKYHVKGFEIISISDDNNWKAWIKAMNKEKMPWLQLLDNSEASALTLYMVDYIPFYVLLDKEGKILVFTDSQEEIDAKLKGIFN